MPVIVTIGTHAYLVKKDADAAKIINAMAGAWRWMWRLSAGRGCWVTAGKTRKENIMLTREALRTMQEQEREGLLEVTRAPGVGGASGRVVNGALALLVFGCALLEVALLVLAGIGVGCLFWH